MEHGRCNLFLSSLPEEKCECRKPCAEIVLRAAKEFSADLSKSFVIGDNTGDINLRKKIGAASILVGTGYDSFVERECLARSNYISGNLLAADELIKRILGNE